MDASPPTVPGQLPLFDAPPTNRERRDQLLADNRGKLTELNRLGAMPDPLGVVMTRLNALLDVVLDERTRFEFELLFETQMSRVLDQCLAEARKRALTAGVGAPPVPPRQLIIPG